MRSPPGNSTSSSRNPNHSLSYRCLVPCETHAPSLVKSAKLPPFAHEKGGAEAPPDKTNRC